MEAEPQTDPETYFQRYRHLVPSWTDFLDCLQRPLPTTVWAHPARLGRDAVASLLAETGMWAEPVSWADNALRLPADAPVGAHWGFMAGLFQIQEEIAMLPARLLDARPGERVLDLCAAPGNKTAQISMAMGNQGTLYANDVRRERLGALRQTIKRLGLRNVVTTVQPAEEYPLGSGPFDAVLADVPCSGEGTWRKGGPAPRLPGGDAPREGLMRRQQRMLERSLAVTRIGGRVVYATCTLSPDENEAVIDAVLRRWGDQLRVRPIRDRVPELNVSQPVSHWRGTALHGGVAECLRLWPQDNDTGGFFVAVIDKVGGKEPTPDRPDEGPTWEPAERLNAILGRFGVAATALGGAGLLAPTARYAHLAPPELAPASRPKPHAMGLPAVGVQAKPDKPTTALALSLGSEATMNVIDCTAPQARAFLDRDSMRIEPVERDAAPGYVLVRHRGVALGVGRLYQGGALESLYPGRWSRASGRRGL
jgi:16S rRNA C967 or C1407 C5-methylase (RsmB/RsmF family)/NOL1/NOP2/fmu family ribosome biogenesis protein